MNKFPAHRLLCCTICLSLLPSPTHTQTQGLLLQVRVAWMISDQGIENGVISRHKAKENGIIDACGGSSLSCTINPMIHFWLVAMLSSWSCIIKWYRFFVPGYCFLYDLTMLLPPKDALHASFVYFLGSLWLGLLCKGYAFLSVLIEWHASSGWDSLFLEI